jgi:hypothetical protein
LESIVGGFLTRHELLSTRPPVNIYPNGDASVQRISSIVPKDLPPPTLLNDLPLFLNPPLTSEIVAFLTQPHHSSSLRHRVFQTDEAPIPAQPDHDPVLQQSQEPLRARQLSPAIDRTTAQAAGIQSRREFLRWTKPTGVPSIPPGSHATGFVPG